MNKRYQALLLLTVVIALLGAGPSAGVTPGQAPAGPPDLPSLQVLEAIEQLQSQDYVVVRGAILQLRNLAEAPNIFLAIKPLDDLLVNTDHRWDMYSRALVASSLVQIAVTAGYPKGERAILPVLDHLQNNPSDMIRASCATALTVSNYPPAEAALLQALQTDPSVLVQANSCRALINLTGGRFTETDCENQAGSGVVNPASMARASAAAAADSWLVLIEQWWKDHLLLPWPGEEVAP